MEILSPASYLENSSWFFEESKSTKWSPAENKAFENALAVFDKDAPDRWQKVAAMVPGKTVFDVMRQYKELENDVSNIEAGLYPMPLYSCTSPFTLEWGNGNGYDGFKQSYGVGGKRSSSTRLPSEQERKKGIPWTEEEHKLFLMGLKKYGKGDWRNISRNFVITRTPTQVASHAQKYFIRQLSGGKDKRRASIHDITTINLNDNQTPSADNKKPPSPRQSKMVSQQQNFAAMQRMPFEWNQTNSGTVMGHNNAVGNSYSPSSYGVNSNTIKIEAQDLQKGAMHDLYFGSQGLLFQIQSAEHYSHA